MPFYFGDAGGGQQTQTNTQYAAPPGYQRGGPPPPPYKTWAEYDRAKDRERLGYLEGGPRDRMEEARRQAEETLEAYKARERERLEETYGREIGAAQLSAAGQAAGGSAAMLRGGSYARGDIARQGAVALESARAAQDLYFENLMQELLARGASYEEAVQAVLDEYNRVNMEEEAAASEAKHAKDAQRAAEKEAAIGSAISGAAAGMQAGG